MNKKAHFSSNPYMSLKRAAAILVLSASFSGTVQGSDPGTTSANFLKLGVGPRAIAMGNAQVGLADDVYATYWNPAGLARLETPQAGFVHNQFIESIAEEYLGFAYPHPTLGTLGVSVTYLNTGTFPGYDAVGTPTTDVGASDTAMGLSYARSIYRDRSLGTEVSLGMTGRLIHERLDTVTANAYAADLGVVFQPGLQAGGLFEGWKAGLTLRNLGTSLKYDKESFPLSRSIDAGISYTGIVFGEDVAFAVDGRKPSDGTQSVGAGLEVTTFRSFILRAGYDTAGDLGSGVRLGAGLKFKTIQIDYAFVPSGDFGNANYIGLTYRFRQVPADPKFLAEKAYQKGLKEYRKRRFTEALVDFNKALELDPSHPDALRLMKQTYDQIKIIVPE